MFVRGFYFAPDNGGGSGGGGNTGGANTSTENTGNQNTENKGKEGQGNGNQNTGQGNGSSNTNSGQGNGSQNTGGQSQTKVTFTPEQQEEINRLIGSARTKARTDAKTEAETEKAKEEGRFKDLHTALETRVKTELEPKAELADFLSTEVNSLIDGEIDKWPEELKEQDPGKEDVKQRSAWVKRSRKLAVTLVAKQIVNSEHGQGGNGGQKPSDEVRTMLSGTYLQPGAAKTS